MGNVDQHSMLLAPAERADAVVDFSKFAGKTLILYNDAPAAFPARVPGYDYYTGAPDLSPTGAPTILPGYGPNTRTVMQVTVAATTPSAPFDVTKLKNAFTHKANGSGAFESSQRPPIVGQAAYNSAMGSSFAAAGECKAAGVTKCDGLVRVNDTGSFTFNTLKSPATKTTVKMEPKAIHDETNSTTFDEFGRMQANLGIEAEPPTPGAQNVTLYPFVNPQTELIDGTNLPKQVVTTDSVTGEPVSDVKITPISDAKDGTQIWRVTHNGVDTHPIHFHLYDVQVLNRVTWDNIIIPNDANENGWKDTVRMSPLEDTIVALRPIIPQVPFEVPNSVRPLNPMMPGSSGAMFFNTDPQGNPLTTPITNKTINFGWEYVWHCHILSHEEMDMMRPVTLALPPIKATWPGTGAAVLTGTGNNRRFTLTWNDNSITETRFVVQRTTNGTTWTTVGTLDQPLGNTNTHGTRTFTDPTSNATTAYKYRVVAENAVGYGSGMPSMTVSSTSDALGVNAPTAPTGLAATLAGISSAPRVNLTWQDTATTEARFLVQRSGDNGATFTQIATVGPRNGTGSVTYADTTAALNSTYVYRVATDNVAGTSAWSNPVTVVVAAPAAPVILTGTAVRQGTSQRATITWSAVPTATSYVIQRSLDSTFATGVTSATVGSVTTYTTGNISRTANWYFRMAAVNALGQSGWSNVQTVTPAL